MLALLALGMVAGPTDGKVDTLLRLCAVTVRALSQTHATQPFYLLPEDLSRLRPPLPFCRIGGAVPWCAIWAQDRGQRATEMQALQMRQLISQLEHTAPVADATQLNGNWRLLAALGESAYRSSPFFWAFRQATAKLSTPVSIPGGDTAAGGPLSSAVFAITDSIPFYDIGAVVQRIDGVCSEEDGCAVPEAGELEAGDGVTSELEPSDGLSSGSGPGFGAPAAFASLESEVVLRIGRNFGLPAAQSLMTTSCVLSVLPRETGDAAGVPSSAIDVDVRVERTKAAQSTLAQLLPQLDDALAFPTGDALDALSSGSATVRLRSTIIDNALRVARPLLDLGDGQLGAVDGPIFVYTRDEGM